MVFHHNASQWAASTHTELKDPRHRVLAILTCNPDADLAPDTETKRCLTDSASALELLIGAAHSPAVVSGLRKWQTQNERNPKRRGKPQWKYGWVQSKLKTCNSQIKGITNFSVANSGPGGLAQIVKQFISDTEALMSVLRDISASGSR